MSVLFRGGRREVGAPPVTETGGEGVEDDIMAGRIPESSYPEDFALKPKEKMAMMRLSE